MTDNHSHDDMSSQYCPVCGDKINEDKLVDTINEEIQELNENDTVLNVEIDQTLKQELFDQYNTDKLVEEHGGRLFTSSIAEKIGAPVHLLAKKSQDKQLTINYEWCNSSENKNIVKHKKHYTIDELQN